MAKQYIHELGDKLSANKTAENSPEHVKEIAPVMYNDGNGNYSGIQAKLDEKAPLASPAFTGNPTAPTVSSASDSSTKVATTAFVQSALVNAPDIKVKATAKSDSQEYKILAAASPSHVSGTATEAAYAAGIGIVPSTNTVTANISGNAASSDVATVAKEYDPAYAGGNSIKEALDAKPDAGDFDNLGLSTTYVAARQRLVFDDMRFSSIYPVIGKYGLAVFTETEDPAATEVSGDREWLLDWRPYLVNMTPHEGETAKVPVAELMKNNWLRKIDGSYATACAVTADQLGALDGKQATLVWGNSTNHSTAKVADTVTGVFDNGTFVPEKFWEYVKASYADVNTAAGTSYTCGIEVEVYDGSNTYRFGGYAADGTDHIPAPWETTDINLSVFIGREKDCYVVDGHSDTTGEYMRGLTAKPVEVGSKKFDPEFFKLRRTGISPGPSTTVGGKIRNFLYNYPGTDSNTAGYPSANAACFKNNGTYPRTVDVSQYNVAIWSRSCNPGGRNGVAYPVAEGGFHAMNAFLCSLEAAYGDRNLWDTDRFSTGISSNDSVKNGIWNGSSFTVWSNGTYGSANANNHYAKFPCMEPQIAASLAAEMGIAENTEFNWNGGVWHFEIPSLSGIKSIVDGRMNCRIYKKITEGLSSAVPAGGYYMLRCALAEGVNPIGDIWWYMGGGCELVYETTGTGATNYQYSFYLEPDQTKWITGNYANSPHVTGSDYKNEKHTDNAKFQAETQYTAIITNSTTGGTGQGYSLSRTGYTPLRKIAGGAYNTGECAYNYRQIDDDGKGSVGIRTRRLVLFRGGAYSDSCSPRSLFARYRPSFAYVTIGCAAQVLLA